MKRLFFIFFVITFFICAGCTDQPAENAKVTQGKTVLQEKDEVAEKAENIQDNIDNANKNSNNIVNNPNKTENIKSAEEQQSDSSSAVLKESSDTATTKPESEVTLWVTRDFAKKQIFAKGVSVGTGTSVMDVLKENLSVETQYGGGFVNSINGLSSGYTGADKKTRDWFFYVNGIITSVGALDYKPAPGEIIWWDYHDWGSSAFTPAAIGAFPEPFRSGYRGNNPGTVVLTAAGCEQQGENLAAHLKNLGVQQIEVKPYSKSLLVEDKKITVVIGLWNQFKDDKYWQEMQKQRKKTGLCMELSEEYFAALDDKGIEIQQYKENVGAVTATGAGMGDYTPVWLITGLDTAGLEGALNTVVKNPRTIKQCFGALVAGNKVIAVPIVR